MVLKDENQDKFRNDLIHYLELKFQDELNSKEYLVAAVLNVGYIKHWYKRSFGSKHYQSGLDSIYDILMKYSPNEKEFEESHGKLTKTDKVISNASQTTSEGLNSMRNLTRPRINSNTDDLSKQTKSKILADETKKFIDIISSSEFESTKSFWIDRQSALPNLYNLALRLLSIPATSAQIERYFSITGQINNKTTNSMSPELLETRSLIKANIKFIE